MLGPWVRYTLIRVGLFAAALALLLVLGVPPWAAAVVAAVVSLCVSYIFFATHRDAVSNALFAARGRSKPRVADARGADELAEDAELERDRRGESEAER